MKGDDLFEEMSEQRKKLQADGDLPEWFTTQGWQAYSQKYQNEDTFKEQIKKICYTLSKYLPKSHRYQMRDTWIQLIMNNHAYLATPVLGNVGEHGCPVSCSGGYVQDSILGFGTARLEASLLSQQGFGTSAYLGAVRHRGAEISTGGTADGAVPVFDDFCVMAEKVSQGSRRRGAWAGYLPIDHPDAIELMEYIKRDPNKGNLGWCVSDQFTQRLESGDQEAEHLFQKALYTKCVTGKGYLYFTDKVHRAQPQMYHDLGLRSQASNLCSEITLHADPEHTFTCVLSGMCASTYDQWKGTGAVYCMTWFLDCVVSYFLDKARDIPGLEAVIRGTEKSRALGLGLSGFHTLVQSKYLPLDSMEAHYLNSEIFRHMQLETGRATRDMAETLGEPEWCKGYNVRNTHRTACAPNVTSSLIFGSESQGIQPWYGNVYAEGGASGSLLRINPLFVQILKDHKKYNKDILLQVQHDSGSVRSLDFLSDREKLVLRTAFEIPQEALLNLASARQSFVDQSQSLNLFFAADESEEYIAQVHKQAFLDPKIKSLYYLRTQSGVQASKGCTVCES